jgi:large repetitive protein
MLTNPLPAGTSFVSATRSDNVGTLTTPKGNGSTVSWSLPTLNSGQSVTLTVVVKASAKAGTTLSNTATVSNSSPVDPNTANNSSTVSTSVIAKR